MRSAGATLHDGIGLWLPYASVQHKLQAKCAALHKLEDQIRQRLMEHKQLDEQICEKVTFQVH